MILPLLDKRYNQNTPVATYSLVALNLVIFLSVRPATPAYLETVQEYGLSRANLASIPLLTHMFLHAEPLHLIGNMLALWFFGRNLERIMGTLIFAPFYLASGLIAGLAQAGLTARADLPLIGASGAIYGVIAGYVVFFPRRRVKAVYLLSLFSSAESALLEISAWLYIVLFVLFQDVVLFAVARGGDMVGHWAHFAGFAFGAGITALLRVVRFRGAPEEVVQEGEKQYYRTRAVKPSPQPPTDLRRRTVSVAAPHRRLEEDSANLTSIILLEDKQLQPEYLVMLQQRFPLATLNPRYSIASNLPEQDALAVSRLLSGAGVRHFVLPQEYVIRPPVIEAVIAVDRTPENLLAFTDESGNLLVRRPEEIFMLIAAQISSEKSAPDRYVLDVYASNPWVCYRMTGYSTGIALPVLRSAARVLTSALPDVRGTEYLRPLLFEEKFSGERFETPQEYERWAAWQLQLTQLYRMKHRGGPAC